MLPLYVVLSCILSHINIDHAVLVIVKGVSCITSIPEGNWDPQATNPAATHMPIARNHSNLAGVFHSHHILSCTTTYT
jgi:hypothetical protein